jgi:tRNA-2-methylthio-N6-dimethylallyladenosine synthase
VKGAFWEIPSNYTAHSIFTQYFFKPAFPFHVIYPSVHGPMPFVFFETFGCQMNVADSDMLAQALYSRGYVPIEDGSKADLIVINTCSVREHAEVRAKARIHELCARKKKHGSLQEIWVIGCMAQRLGNGLKEKEPGIDRVIGAKNIVAFVQDLLHAPLEAPARSHGAATAGVSVLVPIMRGCNNYCAYCVVPSVRGDEVSIPLARIEDDISRLIDNGTKEVTLLGQNVNSYRDGDADFSDLLARIHELPGLTRIRFTTSHPRDCTDKLIRTMADHPKICRHLHLPVQSGSTRILGEMNRGYDRETYLSRIEAVRRAMPDIDITTDAMVGFPSETERDFQDTLSLFRNVRFTTAFMFAYSKRDNTRAAPMADDVPSASKKERLAGLIELQTTITKDRYASMVGKSLDVLFVERKRGGETTWMGQDDGCKRTLLTCNENIAGMILPVRAVRSSGMTLVVERT